MLGKGGVGIMSYLYSSADRKLYTEEWDKLFHNATIERMIDKREWKKQKKREGVLH